VLEAVELPAGVADLDPGLADVDADDLSHLARPSSFLSSRRGFSFLGQGGRSLFLSLLFPKCVRSGDKKGRRRGEERERGTGERGAGGFLGALGPSLVPSSPQILLCKKKILYHIKISANAWSTKC
jgi:hypothetical protein